MAHPGEICCARGVVNQMSWQGAHEQRRRRIFQVHPLQVSLTVKHRRGAAATECRASVMPDDCVRDVSASIAAQASPVRQIDVLVRREKVFVESAEFLEDVPRNQTCRPADTKHLSGGAGGVGTRAMMPLERAPSPKYTVAGAIDDRTVVHVDDARGRQEEARRNVDAVAQRAKPHGVRDGVVVEKRKKLASRRLCAGVISSRKTSILAERNDADARKAAADEVNGTVG